MKTVKIRCLKICNAIIAGLLAFLGFTCSCDPVAEYGTPSATFKVNGIVSSAETEHPIENVRVIMQGDTTYTDGEGRYQVSDQWGFPTDQTYAIQFQDIDHDLFGSFQDIDTTLEFKNPEFSGGDGHWDQGETSQEFNVKMDPKK